ncbi:methylthioribose kinase [Bacillus sp. AGMB 02131]|uniref:Methylthioribose kinase n=1 Tax=Peribacillus faecalis TaxID=2772559 RepID=A0A927CSX9_9BACI|nr:methylthioribose kinase [Peribacillus faecalis]MBD3106846.1 methylthioribose kinase [Peribacillus faecalis]
MIQRFIELGEGYSDLYELIDLAKAQQDRVAFLLSLQTTVKDRNVVSLAVILKPTDPGKFQPIYVCREGVPDPEKTPNKRFEMFEQLAKEIDKNIIPLQVKPSNFFAEKELYYQHLIGILRMNRYLPPLS